MHCNRYQVNVYDESPRRVEVGVSLMRGEKGLKGDTGPQGPKGDKGDTVEYNPIAYTDIDIMFGD